MYMKLTQTNITIMLMLLFASRTGKLFASRQGIFKQPSFSLWRFSPFDYSKMEDGQTETDHDNSECQYCPSRRSTEEDFCKQKTFTRLAGYLSDVTLTTLQDFFQVVKSKYEPTGTVKTKFFFKIVCNAGVVTTSNGTKHTHSETLTSQSLQPKDSLVQCPLSFRLFLLEMVRQGGCHTVTLFLCWITFIVSKKCAPAHFIFFPSFLFPRRLTSGSSEDPPEAVYLYETDVTKYVWHQEWRNPVYVRRVDSSVFVFESFISPIFIYKSCLQISLSWLIIK
jgi:hypothetical protein